jgi:hypothetical protein
MKTSELIALLQKEDPSGEMEVGVDGADIECVESVPYGYDGAQEVLVRKDGVVVAGRVLFKGGERVCGRRLKIHALPLEEALLENPDLPIDVVPDSDQAEAQVRDWRRKATLARRS